MFVIIIFKNTYYSSIKVMFLSIFYRCAYDKSPRGLGPKPQSSPNRLPLYCGPSPSIEVDSLSGLRVGRVGLDERGLKGCSRRTTAHGTKILGTSIFFSHLVCMCVSVCMHSRVRVSVLN
jgi:hypothetical protein